MDHFKKLGRAEMKNVTGGVMAAPSSGSCSYYLPHSNAAGGPVVTYNVSKDDAKAYTNGVSGAHWCCDDCGTASWYGI